MRMLEAFVVVYAYCVATHVKSFAKKYFLLHFILLVMSKSLSFRSQINLYAMSENWSVQRRCTWAHCCILNVTCRTSRRFCLPCHNKTLLRWVALQRYERRDSFFIGINLHSVPRSIAITLRTAAAIFVGQSFFAV